MKTYHVIKSAATIGAIVSYVEALLDTRFKCVKKNRYNAPCPFHADTQDRFMVYVNKDDEVRFHCFGACKGDWDIYDLIMLRKKYPFRRAQQVWAAHLGVTDFKFDREVPLSAKSWLYGIDQARHYIRHYRTIILVEGLFDYFAFTNLLHDQDKAVVVSTLGSYFTPEAAAILKGLDIEHYIVAYDWNELGRNGIERIAAKTGGWVYYLGGLADGQAPYDMLEPVISAISGFSLKDLKTNAQ
jgi:DNA primase